MYLDDGKPALEARLYDIVGIAVDKAGDIYVVDKGSNRVRKIDHQTSLISTLAGRCLPLAATMVTEACGEVHTACAELLSSISTNHAYIGYGQPSCSRLDARNRPHQHGGQQRR